ncbi:conjugative transposon protein TraM [Bacteroides thetaiotaomicron]|uniref:conjugative transposon protein TraM n=1 Tax=Bacteroides thetaiotaomicron TaxID=818 RepID=UPI0018AB6597|nr:conjugative transposon protein TraM [Bacteroides thetaiotaomicron]MDC2216119.1 conjugative transposon protein TraM [Bacteroides thetaiotaomicron]
MSTDADRLKQKQKIRKYLVFTGMFLLFLGCMWLIFAPSEKDRQEAERKTGFNAELPDPRGTGIEADKMAAYEQADMRRRQEEKMRTLADFSAMTDGHSEEDVPELDIVRETDSRPECGSGNDRTGAFASSASAYNDINATLGSFYESPEEDPEKEALKAEVEQLRQAAAAQTAGPSYEEQVALLEKSYELAARYMPSGGRTGTAESQEAESPSRERNAKAVPVGLVSSPVVSSLPQPLTDSVQFARLLSGADAGFHTAVGSAGTQRTKNTIRACVHGDQTVISGQSVRLRLLEAMRVGRHVLPRNTLLTGEGRIQGERLGIEILQVEYDGAVIPVELTVLDSDGQDGIFIPGSTEENAVREVAANMGQSLGTTISITNQSAGDQLLSELGRGAIQGLSQYISKKMREEKVHLKSGYELMLYQNDNQ